MFGLATLMVVFADFDTMDVDSMPFFPLFSARVVSWIRRKTLFATWHEVTDLASWQAYIGRTKGVIAWAVERLALHSADTIISVSKHTTLRLRANGFKKRIVTVPLGVDLANIYTINASAQKSDVIFVGRLVAHKNVDLLIRAIAIAKLENPRVIAKIIGNGPEKPALARLIKQLDLDENISLIGTVEKDNDLYGLMKASKMFILPSIREGFSVVALEANAAGIPVITTNHPDNAARELVTNGVNGYIVDPSAEAIAEGIATILENRKAMKPENDIKQYDWDAVAENIKKALTA